jgi:hypothetical protein
VAEPKPTLAEYQARAAKHLKLFYLAQPAGLSQCFALEVAETLRTDIRVLVDSGADISLMTADTAKRLGVPFQPCSFSVATSCDGGQHSAVIGRTGLVRCVYGAGSVVELATWPVFFVVPDAGNKKLFDVLMGNVDLQQFDGILDAGRGCLCL